MLNTDIAIIFKVPSTEFLDYILELEKSGKEVSPYATSGIWEKDSRLLKVDDGYLYCAPPNPEIFNHFPLGNTLILSRSIPLQYLIDTGVYEHIKDFKSVEFFGTGNLEEEMGRLTND